MIAWLLISFFVLLFLGVPIAMSLGLSAMGGILFLGGGSTVTIAQRMFEGMNSFALLAIPLYTFAGFTMSKGGISKRLMDFCYSIVGHIYGGLAHVNVLSSMIFAGISGSAVADTAGVSGMFMPEMIRKGYSKNFTVAVTAISSGDVATVVLGLSVSLGSVTAISFGSAVSVIGVSTVSSVTTGDIRLVCARSYDDVSTSIDTTSSGSAVSAIVFVVTGRIASGSAVSTGYGSFDDGHFVVGRDTCPAVSAVARFSCRRV